MESVTPKMNLLWWKLGEEKCGAYNRKGQLSQCHLCSPVTLRNTYSRFISAGFRKQLSASYTPTYLMSLSLSIKLDGVLRQEERIETHTPVTVQTLSDILHTQ